MSEQMELYNKNTQKQLEKFQMLLNQYPEKDEIQINKQARGAKYLPIAVIERLLDENYSGLWQTTNFRWQVVANEIIGSIDLQVYHPTERIWITRTGSASAMIQTEKGKPIAVESKYPNTLVKDFPHLKTECLKNAAKSLGVRFGRSLNRGEHEEYNYLSDTVADLSDKQKQAWGLVDNAAITDPERAKVEKRINRATGKALDQLIDWLERRQIG